MIKLCKRSKSVLAISARGVTLSLFSMRYDAVLLAYSPVWRVLMYEYAYLLRTRKKKASPQCVPYRKIGDGHTASSVLFICSSQDK